MKDVYAEDEEGRLVNNEVIRTIVEAFGYDGIIDSTVSEKFKNMNLDYDTTHYIAFSPNQIKSSEAITKDDDGKIIPLSQRFKESEDDIRYSKSIEPKEEGTDKGFGEEFWGSREGKRIKGYARKYGAAIDEEKQSAQNGYAANFNESGKYKMPFADGKFSKDFLKRVRGEEVWDKKDREEAEAAGQLLNNILGNVTIEFSDKPFDGGNSDSRKSIVVDEKTDAEYLDAVNKGDMETAERMVREAAKAAGYTDKAYHGTPIGGFTSFDRDMIGSNSSIGRGRFSFTSDKSTADIYANKNNTAPMAGTLVSSLNKLFREYDSEDLRNLFKGAIDEGMVEWDADLVVADGAWGLDYVDFDTDWEYSDPERYSSPQEAKQAKKLAEYKGTRAYIIDELKRKQRTAPDSTKTFFEAAFKMLEGASPERTPMTYSVYLPTPDKVYQATADNFNNIAWEAAYDPADVVAIELDNGETRYFVDYSHQIKSADPVTYDDNGNVISLSQRFNMDNPDIRYMTSQGKVVGEYDRKNGKITLYPGAKVKDVVHEYAHGLWQFAEQEAKEGRTTLRDKFHKIAKSAPTAVKKAVGEAYKLQGPGVIMEECFTHELARKSEQNQEFAKAIKTASGKSWYKRAWRTIKDSWGGIARKMGYGKADIDKMEKMNAHESAEYILKQMAQGKHFGDINPTPDGGGKRKSISGIYTGSEADYDKPSLLKVGTGEEVEVNKEDK
jgi:hypothetical protein